MQVLGKPVVNLARGSRPVCNHTGKYGFIPWFDKYLGEIEIPACINCFKVHAERLHREKLVAEAKAERAAERALRAAEKAIALNEQLHLVMQPARGTNVLQLAASA